MSTRLALAAIILALAACTTPSTPGAPDPTGQTQATDPVAAAPHRVTSDVLFTGNTSWARFVEDWSRASGLGAKYPFSRLGEFHRNRYDAWVTGLECPIVSGPRPDSAEQDRLLQFACDPAYLREASKWFTAMSIATNHTQDQGIDGLRETRRHLEKAGIQYFGDADPRRIRHTCNTITLPVQVQRADGSTTDGHLPVAMCGFNGVFRIPPQEGLDEVMAFSDLMPTFAFPHSGLEYVAEPDSIKVAFNRSLVDHGADAVLGDHPHWVQVTEAWRGRLIVHSMGNFIFDQQDDREVTRSAAIKLRLTVAETDSLADWLQLGEDCRQPGADCTDLVRAAGLPRVQPTFEFGVVGSTNIGRVTHPASPAATQAIRERMRWEQTMAALRPPYSSR